MQKNLKVIKSMLLTAPAVTNKAANEKKNCPYRLIPKSPAIFTQECCDKWVHEHYLSDLLIFINSLAELDLPCCNYFIWLLEISPELHTAGARGNHLLWGLTLVVMLSI